MFLSCRMAFLMRVTLNVQPVLSALYGREEVSSRLVRSFPQTRTPALSPARVENMPESHLPLRSSSERSTKVQSEAWAAPKPVCRVCHSLSFPAQPLCHPTTLQRWCLRRNTWLATGWTMIWAKSSRRRRGGYAWNRMGSEERTCLRLQQQELTTGVQTQTYPEVFGVFICVFHSQRSELTFHFCNSSLHTAGHSSSSRGHSLRKNSSAKPHQVKMTQIPGMVRLGRREVSRPRSPTTTDEDDMRPQTPPPQTHAPVRKLLTSHI